VVVVDEVTVYAELINSCTSTHYVCSYYGAGAAVVLCTDINRLHDADSTSDFRLSECFLLSYCGPMGFLPSKNTGNCMASSLGVSKPR